jgi:hypothetical protein
MRNIDLVYEMQPVKISKEDRKKFCKRLARKMKGDLERRNTREKKWRVSRAQYMARSERKDAADRDCKLDVTTTRERGIQAKSRLINPIQSYRSKYVASATSPEYQDFSQELQQYLDWRFDEIDYLDLMHDSVKQAQIYPKATVVIPVVKTVRKVKYWEPQAVVDEMGLPAMDEQGLPAINMVEVEIENEEINGALPEVIPEEDVLHPDPSPSIDDAEYFARKIRTTRARLLADAKAGRLRKDWKEVFGDKFQKIGKAEHDDDDYTERFKPDRHDLPEGERDLSSLDEPVELWQPYTTYEGREVVLLYDLEGEKDLSFVENHFHEFPRPFATFAWEKVLGSIDGTSFCQILEPLHKAIRALITQQLDQGSRSNEPLLCIPEDEDARKAFPGDRAQSGIAWFSDPNTIDKIKEIRLSAGQQPMANMLSFLMTAVDNVSSITSAFFGEEVAERPTATGTTSVIEEAKQPLYLLIERYRKFLLRIGEVVLSRDRQYNPTSVKYYVESRDPQSQGMLQEMLLNWPSGYWRHHIMLDTKVSSQQMSRAVRKQEAAAMLDKLTAMFPQILELSNAATTQPGLMPVASILLQVFSKLASQFLEEFDVQGSEQIEQVPNALQAGQQIQQQFQQLQAQLQEAMGQIAAATGQAPGGAPGGAGPGARPGVMGPPQASPRVA